jgi:hypothetical protein
MTTVVEDAHSGCYIAVPLQQKDSGILTYPDWTFGTTNCADLSHEIPDILIDPENGMITVMNTSRTARTFYVTVAKFDRMIDSRGCEIASKRTMSSTEAYVTFISLVYPGFGLGLCRLVPASTSKRKRLGTRELSCVEITSDVQEFLTTDPPRDKYELDVFPLVPRSGADSFLCTQSAGGKLTHFAHPSTYYAVDFRCDIGTSIVSIFDGEVVEIRNDATNSGVRVEDLFSWNSIMIKALDTGLCCEYVHVRKDSFRVSLGERVKKGDVLCESGASGFCPEPHLHFEIHGDSNPGSPSIPIFWKGESFRAGHRYS